MNLKKEIMKGSVKLGFGEEFLEIYSKLSESFVLNEELENTDSSITNYEYNGDWKGEVLFLPRSHLAIYIMAHAFKTRGYKPLMLNDLSLDYPKSQEGYDQVNKQIKEFREKKLCEVFNVEQIRIEDIINIDNNRTDDLDNNLGDIEYKGIKASEFARCRTRRFLQKYTLNMDNSYEKNTYLRHLNAAFNLVDASEKLIDQRNIEAAVVWEPAYIKGIPGEAANKKDIPGYSIDSGYRDMTRLVGRFSNRIELPNYTDKRYAKKFMTNELNSYQREVAEKRLEGRITGSDTRFEHTQLAEKGYEKDSDDKLFGLFSNLIWDASLSPENSIFESPLKWVGRTIEEFEKYDDRKLIIKTHPAEELRGTNQKVSDWIRENYAPLPEHVELLEPDTDIDPYKLVKELDSVIVYNSTIGLESACFGEKVIVTGDTHYKDLGFTLDPETEAEYFEMIENIEDYEKEDVEELAKRYFYYLFELEHFDFPFIETIDMHTEKVHPIKHEDLKPGNKNIDMMCKGILENRPVVKSPERDHLLDLDVD